ncbi:carboxyl transferase domain-containing protein [Micromonospora sp. BRA006-A]|nr:carboxyl transferase domain-containing protein [Micromonospora sp. BRA006-A]
MRKLQLEYGAEIGRAIVNFRGPIVFCVISRYHGGAFVVFSKALNPDMTVLAIEGSFASVLGGAPAAAVVFAGEVAARTAADARVRDLEAKVAAAAGTERATLTAELDELRASVRAEARRGGRRVRPGAQHPARGRGRFGRRGGSRRRAAARVIEAIEARLR